MTLTRPTLFTKPFADTGQKNVIPDADASPLASLEVGFPPITMQPLPSGGKAPQGKDFNGILHWITQHLRWLGAGGQYAFDSTLSTAIGGYPKGAVIQSADKRRSFVSMVDDNTSTPETVSNIGLTWAPYGGAVEGVGSYALEIGSILNAFVIVMPHIKVLYSGLRVAFRVNTGHGNTDGVANLSLIPAVGQSGDLGGQSLIRNDGVAQLGAGDLPALSIVEAVYDLPSNKWMLVHPVLSQYAPPALSSVPTGTILEFAGSTLPAGGFVWCDGSAVSRATYAGLFAALGTVFGAGNGSTTFNVPDKRGRVSIGAGSGLGLTARTLGQTNIGEERHVLYADEMPAHVHNSQYDSRTSTGIDYTGGDTGEIAGFSVGSSRVWPTTATGGNAAHNNMQPSLVTNFIIKT